MKATHAALLLAAGASRRLGSPKQLIEIEGESLLRRAARAALQTRPAAALVVLGAQAERLREELDGLPLTTELCADWECGMGASLACGLRTLPAHIDGVLVLLCDQVALTPSHLQRLVEHWRARPQRAVASAYADTLGVPALLPRAWFDTLLHGRDDIGARELLRMHDAQVDGIAAAELAGDLDTRDDLRKFTSRR